MTFILQLRDYILTKIMLSKYARLLLNLQSLIIFLRMYVRIIFRYLKYNSSANLQTWLTILMRTNRHQLLVVGLLTTQNLDMPFHVRFLWELFSAIKAIEHFQTLVDQNMPLDIANLFELLVAAWVITYEAALAGLGSFIILPFLVKHGRHSFWM